MAKKTKTEAKAEEPAAMTEEEIAELRALADQIETEVLGDFPAYVARLKKTHDLRLAFSKAQGRFVASMGGIKASSVASEIEALKCWACAARRKANGR